MQQLTVTELETLAVMLHSGVQKTIKATNRRGVPVWSGQFSEHCNEVYEAFYMIQADANGTDIVNGAELVII